MQLIPVLDLARGVAVHARGGARERYAPLESALAPERLGDALALARAYRERLGAGRCYVADLDAITGDALQENLIGSLADPLAGFGSGLLVDAGATDAARARRLLALGVSQVVVALETLPSFDALDALGAGIGWDRVIFGLDLRQGAPVGSVTTIAGRSALDLFARAVACGVRTALVLDLARIGVGGGVDLDLIRQLKRRFPAVSLLAGGGVGSEADLRLLSAAGCDGVLVGTALHTGVIAISRFGVDQTPSR